MSAIEHPLAPGLEPSSRGPGLLVGEGVEIAADAEFGAYVVLHTGTVIGPGCTIQDHATIGKREVLARTTKMPDRGWAPAVVEAGAQIGCGAVVAAGVRVGAGAIVGDGVLCRPGSRIGEDAVVGQGSNVGRDVFIGARAKVFASVMIAGGTVIEADAVIAPSVTLLHTADMGRREPGEAFDRAPVLRRGCRVGANAVIFAGVEIGAAACVGAGAVVTRSVAPATTVVGAPARPLGRRP